MFETHPDPHLGPAVQWSWRTDWDGERHHLHISEDGGVTWAIWPTAARNVGRAVLVSPARVSLWERLMPQEAR
jgi:hypothetical protein